MTRERITQETLYTFDELTEDAQQKAIEKLWDLNVDYDWWDCITDEIGRVGEISGLGCRYGREFDIDRGSYIHIDHIGCTFSELTAHYEKTVEEYPDFAKDVIAPFLDGFTARDKRYLVWLEKIDALRQLSGETSNDRRGIRSEIDTDVWARHKRLNPLIDKLDASWAELLRDLEHYYVKLLREEYEYQTSAEQIAESIRANEYEFLEDGTMA